MMLAKLSGWPMTTQVAKVSRPASRMGASVSATSRTLLSTRPSSATMTMKDSTPAWMKAV